MNICTPSTVPLLTQDRLASFFETMQQHEQDIREAALAVDYCNVFDQTATVEQCTRVVQALGSLAGTIHQFHQSFVGISVPLLVLEMREAAQGPWRLLLEMIDELIVFLASLRAVLSVMDTRDVLLQHDIVDQHKKIEDAVADAFCNDARWRDQLRFESLRFVRLRAEARLHHAGRRWSWT